MPSPFSHISSHQAPSWLTKQPITHRGLHDGNKYIFENSLSAFQKSIDHHFAIECDVHLSSDGVPVVFHDETLERLTSETGTIRDYTAHDLANIHLGSSSDRIMSLRHVLETIGDKTPIIIELKGVKGRDEGFVKSVANILERYCGRAAIMSFDHHLVRDFAKDAPDCIAGLTATGSDTQALEQHFSMLAYPLCFTSFDVEDLDNHFVKTVTQQLNWQLITWTVRTPQQVQQTRRLGGQITFEGFMP